MTQVVYATHKEGLLVPEKPWRYLHVKNGRGKVFAIHSFFTKLLGFFSQQLFLQENGTLGKAKKNPLKYILSLFEDTVSLSSSKETDYMRKGTDEPDFLLLSGRVELKS